LIGAEAAGAIGQGWWTKREQGRRREGRDGDQLGHRVVLRQRRVRSLQDALNTIGRSSPSPTRVWQWVRKRVLSMGMVLGIAVLL
jgi:hypothetical protein